MQTYARIAGVLLLVTIVAGGFGEAYVPMRVIAHGVAASESLLRLGFAAYLVEAICDIALSLVFYVLLRPVQRDVSLLAAFFGLVSTSVFAVAELFFFAARIDARWLKLYSMGGTAFLAFYGIASLLRGWLIYQSRYLPKFLGVLLVLGGAAFVVQNALFVLAPAHTSDFLMLPMFLAVVALAGWLLVKGVRPLPSRLVAS